MLRYKINKISEIDKIQLSNFYKKIYQQRCKSLTSNWKWWYRVGYSEFEPLILSTDGKIIGQAGLLPIDLKIKEKKLKRFGLSILQFFLNLEVKDMDKF